MGGRRQEAGRGSRGRGKGRVRIEERDVLSLPAGALREEGIEPGAPWLGACVGGGAGGR